MKASKHLNYKLAIQRANLSLFSGNASHDSCRAFLLIFVSGSITTKIQEIFAKNKIILNAWMEMPSLNFHCSNSNSNLSIYLEIKECYNVQSVMIFLNYPSYENKRLWAFSV